MRPYLRAANLTWHGIDVSDVKEMHFTDDEAVTYRLEAGDILLSEASGSAKEVGKPGVWRGQLSGDMCFQNTLLRVRPEDGLDSDFLYYRLLHECLRGGFSESSRGVGIHHLGAAGLAGLVIEVPPTAEQCRIASQLNLQLGTLSQVNCDLDTLTKRLVRARRHVIQEATRGAFRADVPVGGDASAELLVALGAAPTAPTEDVPPIPGGWAWGLLGELASVVGGVTKDSKREQDANLVEVPYLRVANVQEGALQLDSVSTIRVPEAKAERLRLRAGDVLMNEGGDRDKLGRGWVWEGQIADCIHQNHVFRARVHEDVMHPKLLSWHGNTFGRAWFETNGKQTTNLASISLTNVKRLPVPVPPRAEQDQIVGLVEGHLRILDQATTGIAALKVRCETLRRSVLTAAFAGRLLPQDPTEEHAEFILKNIAQARQAAAVTARATRTRTVRRTRTPKSPEPAK